MTTSPSDPNSAMNVPTRYMTAEEAIDTELHRMENAWRALRAMLEDPDYAGFSTDPQQCEIWRTFRDARNRILLIKRTFRRDTYGQR